MKTEACLDKRSIEGEIIRILADMTRDWEVQFSGQISSQTYLVRDLGCESIDIVMLIVSIEQNFGRKGLPFEELLTVDGHYVNDFTVGDIVNFLTRVLA